MAENNDLPPGAFFAGEPPPAPQPLPEYPLPAETTSTAEVLPPTPVTLRTEHGPTASRPEAGLVVLTTDALWIQTTWQLRHIPLQSLGGIETRREGKKATLAFRPGSLAEVLLLTFDRASEAQYWATELEAQVQQLPLDAPPTYQRVPDGVTLLERLPSVAHEDLGPVEYLDRNYWGAERGLRLRAGLRGADAVHAVRHTKVIDVGANAWYVSGTSVRIEDSAVRQQVRRHAYMEQVRSLGNRMLLLVVAQAVVLFLCQAVWRGAPGLQPATGETPAQALVTASLGMAIVYTWPLLLVLLLRFVRWPPLLRAAGLAVVAVTAGRGLVVLLAHQTAVGLASAGPRSGGTAILLDPIMWLFIIWGMVLWARARRLGNDARDILPQEAPVAKPACKVCGYGVVATSAAYALGLIIWAGITRYQTTAYLLQPGVDTAREQEALLALNEGVAQADKGDLAAAERSFQTAMKLWEQLTTARAGPPGYRANLAQTFYNLGWVQHRNGRLPEADAFFTRALACGDDVVGAPGAPPGLGRCLEDARRILAESERDKAFKALDVQENIAVRKYEEAQIKAQQGQPEAEGLYQEAITLWEEILPKAANPEYHKSTTSRLAYAYLQVGQLRHQWGKTREAEAPFRKAIEYAEKAVALEPDRPLWKHYLETARQALDGQREQALQEELNRLEKAERHADIADVYQRGVAEQEQRLRAHPGDDAATRWLAFRLERFAWFLAHCPDRRIRNTKQAVKHARRATDLQPTVGPYWYTLAMVRYRNGEWQDSLTALDRLKAVQGSFDASAWLVTAMDLHQLKRRDDARAAYRKAVAWIDDQKRQAGDNGLLLFQLDLRRSALEPLKREVEDLLDGKGID